MAWLIWSAVFVVALALLVKSADKFVDSSIEVGRALGVPGFVIGITLVALGTSLPELATSIAAIYSGSTAFIIGNAVGSNATNILLVLGAASLVHRDFQVRRPMGRLDLPLLLVSAALIILFSILGNSVGRVEGGLLLAIYLAYLAFVIITQKKNDENSPGERRARPYIWLVIAAVGIYFGASYTIEATIRLTRLIGFADTSVLALSAVALGTSLPELLVSVSAARRGSIGMAVGNVIGSNIFNSLVVIGLPALIIPLPTSRSVLVTGLPFMALATVLCYLVLSRRRIRRPMGIFFLFLYAAFLARLFGLV